MSIVTELERLHSLGHYKGPPPFVENWKSATWRDISAGVPNFGQRSAQYVIDRLNGVAIPRPPPHDFRVMAEEIVARSHGDWSLAVGYIERALHEAVARARKGD